MFSVSAYSSPMRRLYRWLLDLAESPKAVPILGAVSFFESSIFPLPPDIMLIPMILANRARAWFLALVCSLTSIAGGILGYTIGYFLFESIGQWVIQAYHLEDSFQNFKILFQDWGFWIIMAKGLTPIPYKLITITSGACELDFFKFLFASIITRSSRFYLVSGLVWCLGDKSKGFIEQYLGWILFATLVFIGIGFAAVKVFAQGVA